MNAGKEETGNEYRYPKHILDVKKLSPVLLCTQLIKYAH